MRTYEELIRIADFEERLKYAYIGGGVGVDTFGFNRYLNQYLYNNTPEWKRIRRDVILRDDGNDLAFEDRPIVRGIIVHHLEPITVEDIRDRSPKVLNMNNLVCVSLETHNFIHYGAMEKRIPHTERYPGDQCPWR